MTELEQAKELRRRVDQALGGLQQLNYQDFTEDEVMFRFQALRGILIMARNDIAMLVSDWEDDEAENPRTV